MEMVSSKNVEEVVLLLKKELTKTVDQEYEKVDPTSLTYLKMGTDIFRTMNTVKFSFIQSIPVLSNFQRLPPAWLAY